MGSTTGSMLCVGFLVIYVTTLTGNPDVEIVGCLESYYLFNKNCHSCPEQCQTCISNDTCTTCVPGYYGRRCRLTCEPSCSGQCHQEYGHCTLGCPDGQFPDPNSPACFYCDQHCAECSCLTQCVQCVDGFFGTTCSQRCPASCADSLCQQDGECLKCKDGYYKETSGKCVECPNGCMRCVNATACLECQDRYYGPYSGTCIQQCPIKLRMTYKTTLEQSRCPLYQCITKGYCMNDTSPTNINTIQVRNNFCDSLVYIECIRNCSCEDLNAVAGTNDYGYACTSSCTRMPPPPDAQPMKLCHSNASFDDIITSIGTPTYSCDTNLGPTKGKQYLLKALVTGGVIVMAIILVIAVSLYRKKHQDHATRQALPPEDHTSQGSASFSAIESGYISDADERTMMRPTQQEGTNDDNGLEPHIQDKTVFISFRQDETKREVKESIQSHDQHARANSKYSQGGHNHHPTPSKGVVPARDNNQVARKSTDKKIRSSYKPVTPYHGSGNSNMKKTTRDGLQPNRSTSFVNSKPWK